MEWRHLRYFAAVAEAGSLTVAAEQTLHVTTFAKSADSRS
jgi:DNA-binding transcriptional LysR family regulator